MTYKNLTDVRLNDATVHRMTAQGAALSDVVIQLANEKAELLRRLINCEASIVRTRHVMHTPMMMPFPLTPNIPPNTPQ